MLVDNVRIYVKGGDGGSGCQSLYKDLYNRRGVPDGGDGGDGGNVIIEAVPELNNLYKLRFRQHYKADNGAHGGSNNKTGKKGKHRIIKVPPGTIIKDVEKNIELKDLSNAGETIVVASGGKGGRGNGSISEAEKGAQGEQKTIRLELKLVADVGVVGLPNAGKSTLVSRLSKAKVKIDSYPFTTKSPAIGVVTCGNESFIVADMPGLIEGAHSGKGLGDRFLKHIERTSILLHLVDVSPADGSDPVENYKTIEKELSLYSDALAEKKRVTAVAKMDLPGSEKRFQRFSKKIDNKVFAISSVDGRGLSELVGFLNENVKRSQEENKSSYGQDRYSSPYRREEQNR